MAKNRLSAATYVTRGYGQVEPNHLSAKRTGEIYAQLPVNKDVLVLDNGMFMKYDYAHNEVNATGVGEWMLVYNEVKLYDERETEEDFALIKTDYVSGEMVPRLFKTHEGDIYTTNCLNATTVAAGDVFAPEATEVTVDGKTYQVGILTKVENPETVEGMKWAVAATTNNWTESDEYFWTMPDNQKAVKLVRIA